jgi:hypothetical protein
MRAVELSIIMPCLNEALTVGTCITKARGFLEREKIDGEIIVADNGSTDGSVELAEQLGARVVHVPERGYGRALSYGIREARGTFVIMGDSDDSYDFSGLAPFVARLREGCDLVMGNRFLGGIAPKAMPFMHRYVGNPMLSALGRSIYKARVCGDFYCGLRGFRKTSIERLHLQSPGMEFALEMVIKSALHSLKIAEVPTTLSPDGRDRAPHLRTYRDGWRSLRLYLLMSPRWIFGIPAMTLIALGILALLWFTMMPGALSDTVTATLTIFSGCLIALGYQALLLGIFAKLIAVEVGLHPPDLHLLWVFQKQKSLEWMLGGGAALAIGSGIFGIVVSVLWHRIGGTGPRELQALLRLIVLATTGILLGGETILAGFSFGLLHLLAQRRQFRWKRREDVGAKWGRRREDRAAAPSPAR